MTLNEWMDKELPKIAHKLESSITNAFDPSLSDGLDLSGRNEIYKVLDDILSVLFPACYSNEKITRETMNYYLGERLRHISFHLGSQIKDAFKYRCRKDNCKDCNCEDRAVAALMHLIEVLPDVRALLLEDIQAAYDGDPAAKSLDEIVFSYPCIEAIATHRIAHLLYELDVPIIPRIMSERAHGHTGIDIHPGAKIGPRFFIDHGTGVVIGETSTIGKNVKLYQGVTLGALSFPLDKEGKPIKGNKRHPDVEDDVIIYANATILGGDTVIGKGAIIGANTWVTKSVAAGSKIFKS